MNQEAKWSTAEIILAAVNTLAFIPVFFFIVLLLIGAPKDTLDFIVAPLLIFTVSMFLFNFIASAWQADRRPRTAKFLVAAGVFLFIFSVVLILYRLD